MLSASTIVPSDEFAHSVDTPKVLHNSISGQWGGHTFCYTLLGEKRLFWTATAYNEDDKTPTALIGQYSLNDPSDSKFTAIRFTEPNVKSSNQPQIIRTPDGYIHVFIGVTYDIGNPNLAPGKLRYYRSKEPEDISTLVDRTELIPTDPYAEFHLRMNVGISPDGDLMALVILAVSADGSVAFNTPVVFFGKRQGRDFVFQKPMSYEKPMGFFYPQVAVTNDGIVIVGEIWDKKGLYPTRLIHIDFDGKLLYTDDISDNVNGSYFSYDVKPKDSEDWSKLIIYYNRNPEDHNSPKTIDGKAGKGLKFADSRVAVTASNTLTTELFKEGIFTLVVWVKSDLTGNTWQQVFRAGPDPNDTLFLNINGTISWRGWVGGAWAGGMCETAAGVVSKDTWTHVAVVGDAKNFRDYIDGKLAKESNFQATRGNNKEFMIGGYSGGESYSGAVDEFAIFKASLKEADINNIKDKGVMAGAAVESKGKLATKWAELKTAF